MMIVMLIAGIGCLLAGLLAIGFGIPVQEFSFGNTLILSGAVTACTGLIILGLWVVVGANGTILYSPDLQNWTRATAATGNKLNGVFFSSLGPTAGNFVAVGDNGTVLTSPDAMNWTVQPSGVAGFLHGIIAGWGAVLVTGQGGVLLRGAINGTSFEALASGTSQDLEAVASNSQMAVAVGANGTVIYHRFLAESLAEMADPFDGWTQAAPVTSARLRGLAYGNGTFVATGEQGTILTSGDGINWSRRFAGIKVGSLSTANLLGAAFGPVQGRFVAVGTGNAGLFSALTQTIFANVSTRGNVSGSQTLIGGFVVAGTDPRRVLLRADGPVLAGFNVPNPLPDPVITVYDSKQNVVATNAGWTTNASPSAVSAAAQKVGAFTLPSSSKDSAVLLTLQPGAYTAVITTASGNSGTALFESYIY